jgi:aminoglycoside/choline kinase family phosphotransferase
MATSFMLRKLVRCVVGTDNQGDLRIVLLAFQDVVLNPGFLDLVELVVRASHGLLQVDTWDRSIVTAHLSSL